MNRVTSTEYDSPVGPVLLTFVDDALVYLQVAHDGIDIARAEIAQRLGVLPDPDPSPGDHLARQLDEYFDGARRSFEVPLDFLMDPANHRRHAISLSGVRRQWFSMPYDDAGKDRFVWGATAAMLRNFYRFLAA